MLEQQLRPRSAEFIRPALMLLSEGRNHESPLKLATTCWHVLHSPQKPPVAYQLQIMSTQAVFSPTPIESQATYEDFNSKDYLSCADSRDSS